jgi:hypothetical protein
VKYRNGTWHTCTHHRSGHKQRGEPVRSRETEEVRTAHAPVGSLAHIHSSSGVTRSLQRTDSNTNSPPVGPRSRLTLGMRSGMTTGLLQCGACKDVADRCEWPCAIRAGRSNYVVAETHARARLHRFPGQSRDVLPNRGLHPPHSAVTCTSARALTRTQTRSHTNTRCSAKA